MDITNSNKAMNPLSSIELVNTELGVLPDDWVITTVGQVFDSQQGKQLSSKEKQEKKTRKPFLRTSNIFWDRVDVSSIDYMYFTDDEYKKLQLKKNDILLCEGGDIGRTALWNEEIEGCTYQNHLHRLRPKADAYPKFFVLWMQYAMLQKKMYVHNANRTTIPNLSSSRLKSFVFPLPPVSEQKNISDILTLIQDAREKTDYVINSLKELKKSMMKHLFTYGPVSLEEAEHVKLKETEIGSVSEEWDITKLNEIADFKNGINFSRDQKGTEGVLTIDVLNMYGGLLVNLGSLYRVNKKIDDSYILTSGDILFVRSSLKQEGVGWTSLFKSIEEKVTFCGFIIRARLRNQEILPEYLTNYLRTSIARRNLIASSGKVAITNINQGMLGKVQIPLPSISNQQEIVTILSVIDEKIGKEEVKHAALEGLFNSMLSNLMTAKIRVKDLVVTA